MVFDLNEFLKQKTKGKILNSSCSKPIIHYIWVKGEHNYLSELTGIRLNESTRKTLCKRYTLSVLM